LPKYQFTTIYWDYQIDDMVNFCCDEEFYWDEEPASGFCIFHDKDYLHDKTNYEEHKRKVRDRLEHKVNHAISNNEPLLCIGFQLPDFSLLDLGVSKEFTKPVYFNGSQFFGKADFSGANFKQEVNFISANFQEASFSTANFQGLFTTFIYANFQQELSSLALILKDKYPSMELNSKEK
jgi:hypothetical protein